MRNVEDGHVGAPAHASLLDDIRGLIEHLHERKRAARHAACASDPVLLRPEVGEGEARSAAALVDESGVLDRVEDGLHGVLHGYHEAGGELPQLPAGVHQCRRVGQEVELSHRLVEALLPRRRIAGGAERELGLRDVMRHAAEQLIRRFRRRAIGIPLQVAPFKHPHGIGRERNGWRHDHVVLRGSHLEGLGLLAAAAGYLSALSCFGRNQVFHAGKGRRCTESLVQLLGQLFQERPVAHADRFGRGEDSLGDLVRGGWGLFVKAGASRHARWFSCSAPADPRRLPAVRSRFLDST